MDREAPATASERRQERGREDLGTEIPGVPTEPRRADRSGSGEPAAIQSESAGDVAELPESDESPTTRQLATIHTRLVGVLPTGRGPPTNFPAGGLDSQ